MSVFLASFYCIYLLLLYCQVQGVIFFAFQTFVSKAPSTQCNFCAKRCAETLRQNVSPRKSCATFEDRTCSIFHEMFHAIFDFPTENECKSCMVCVDAFVKRFTQFLKDETFYVKRFAQKLHCVDGA